jgi:hypothetical protein
LAHIFSTLPGLKYPTCSIKDASPTFERRISLWSLAQTHSLISLSVQPHPHRTTPPL